MTKFYKLKEQWLGGEVTLKKDSKVWFVQDMGQWYMCFHEGRIKIVKYVIDEDILPLYFEEIKEEQPFLWSDELVYEFGIYNTTHPWVATNLQDFKKSKQQTNTIPLGEKYKQWDIPMNATIKESQPKTERMSVIYFEFDLDKKWLKLHFNKLELSVKKDYSKIKNSIEKILNNE